MKIEYSQDIDKVTMLLYGRTKLGKTPLAATAPKPIFMDVEKRMVSVKDKNVARIKLDTWKEIKKTMKEFKTKEFQKQGFKTIVVDSLSETAQQRFAYHDKQNEKADKPNAYAKYTETYKDVMWLVTELKKLPQNLVVICKQKPIVIEDVEKFRPLLPGQQLGPEIPYQFDIIACLVPYDQDEDEAKKLPEHERNKVLLTKPTENYDCGSPACIDKFECFDLTKIFNKVLNPKKRKKSK